MTGLARRVKELAELRGQRAAIETEEQRLEGRLLGARFTLQTIRSEEWRQMAEDQFSDARAMAEERFVEPTPGIAIAASSDDVRAIAQEAARRDYNRQISDEALGKLDPAGTHIVTPRLFHEHANGAVVPPHIRAQVFLKMTDRGAEEPVEAWMDIPMDLYQGLTRLAKNEATGEWEPVEPGTVREPTAYAPWGDEAGEATRGGAQ